ncbi:LytR/AlgR family response regulator transcription factor [Radiobacillus sp. PE A8.2]|uniref:LytR/AlgR family response regulator transcription factor n=1 Tax=Radiobacillus sp. PE A8.2 TaxID=3380349 RepID=UPI00388E087F
MNRILTVVIAEDNVDEISSLSETIEVHPNFKVVYICSNGEELVNYIIKHKPNLIFADTKVPGVLTSVLKIKSLTNDIHFIIVSNTDQCAISAFELSALDFILRPFKEDRLLVALEKSFHFITNYSDREQVKKLAVSYRGAVFFVKIKDILFVERSGRKTLIHTSEKIIESGESLENMEDKLLDRIFIQTHRPYIINVNHISYITPSGNTFLIYFDQYEKPAFVSKQRINEVKQYIMNLFE